MTIDAGHAQGKEIISISEIEVMNMSTHELRLLERMFSEPVGYVNTEIEMLRVSTFSVDDPYLQIRIRHDVPCITTLRT